jgi:hypothetical protein
VQALFELATVEGGDHRGIQLRLRDAAEHRARGTEGHSSPSHGRPQSTPRISPRDHLSLASGIAVTGDAK